MPREETKRLLVTTSTWENLPFSSACLFYLFSQGVAGGLVQGTLSSGSGAAGGCCKRRRLKTLCGGGVAAFLGWAPGLPFISPSPDVGSCRPTVAAYFGVLHSGSVRSCFRQSEAAASNPPVTCISASPGPCVTGMPSPPCHS